MKRSLEQGLARLEKLAFKRKERCRPLVKRFHELSDQVELMGEADWIWNVYDWLLVPLTLWPIDFEGVAQHTIRILEGKAEMDRAFGLLLRMLRRPPPRKTQETIAKYEHEVEEGRYHGMLRGVLKNPVCPSPLARVQPGARRDAARPQPEGEGNTIPKRKASVPSMNIFLSASLC